AQGHGRLGGQRDPDRRPGAGRQGPGQRGARGSVGMRWFLGAALLLFVALVLEAGLLAYAMYVLLLLVVVSRLLARSWIATLSAPGEGNRATAEAGETVAVNVTVHNAGLLPVPWVIVEEVLPARALIESHARLKVKKKRMKIAMIGSRG